jgi:chemotaxis response regulator CheB
MDGTIGSRAIKAAGGAVVMQSPAEAEAPGMVSTVSPVLRNFRLEG